MEILHHDISLLKTGVCKNDDHDQTFAETVSPSLLNLRSERSNFVCTSLFKNNELGDTLVECGELR